MTGLRTWHARQARLTIIVRWAVSSQQDNAASLVASDQQLLAAVEAEGFDRQTMLAGYNARGEPDRTVQVRRAYLRAVEYG